MIIVACAVHRAYLPIGITFGDERPPISRLNGQGNIGDVSCLDCLRKVVHLTLFSLTLQQLRQAGSALARSKGYGPDLIVAVLPQGSADLYQAIKQ